jgi:serine/threonine-protein kinase RsbW
MLTARKQQHSQGAGPRMTVPHEFNTRFPASEMAVRDALASMGSSLRDFGLDEDGIGRTEIVLAEALNNVVEHAYADIGGGDVELRVKCGFNEIDITILDNGVPVPVHVFAKRSGPDLDVDFEDLPEGGFGWMMIQHMSSHLSYQRVGDTNCLRMTVPRESNL